MTSFGNLPARALGAAAAIAVLLVLAVPDWPGAAPLFVAAAVVASLATVEAHRLFSADASPVSEIALAVAASAATWGVAASSRLTPVLLVLPGFAASAAPLFRGKPSGSVRSFAATGWVAAAAAVCAGLLFRMREISFWLFMTPLLACWAGDTAAYLAGTAFGRHRMAPSVSPGKTWEGFAAGMAGSVGGAMAAGAAGAGPGALRMAVLGAACGLAGAYSDLAESMLKRDCGAKDSGRFIPGHGGLLDRIDSLLGAVPAAWVLMRVWGIL